mmetsp:Transcript_6622/g.23394  ORF Transcript_6622/g.23394 Transcript_6622/m.23394 type:complete len:118 (-) Transcript_6622:203-556(-)
MLRAALPLAMVASAAAFAPAFQPALRTGTTMSMSMDRRQVVQGAALAGAVAPFLGGVQQASAAAKMPADSYTPIITIFDARGCPRGAGEYEGSPAGDNNDEMAVKVVLRKVGCLVLS